MKYIAYITFLFVSCMSQAQDSIGAGATRIPYKFDELRKEILVYYEGMTPRHVSLFLKELERNKSKYREFWDGIPKADRFGVALKCEQKCVMVAKTSKACHGITFVSFTASGNLISPKIEYSHSGMSMEEVCDTFSAQ